MEKEEILHAAAFLIKTFVFYKQYLIVTMDFQGTYSLYWRSGVNEKLRVKKNREELCLCETSVMTKNINEH